MTTDSLTISALYESLNKKQKRGLIATIEQETKKSHQTAWNWVTGRTIPSSVLERLAVAKIVNRLFSLKVNYTTLFPERDI